MAKGFFYENGKLVILRNKKALLAEIDRAIEEAPVEAGDFRTIYEAVIRDKYYGRYATIYGSSEIEAKTRAESLLQSGEHVIMNKIRRPACSVEFGIGGNHKVVIFNEKGFLSEFRRRIGKTPETVKHAIAKARKVVLFRPTAAKQESIGESLMKVNRKGWFTDGHLMIKGEIPKGWAEPTGRPVDASQIMKDMERGNTEPAELVYYCLSDPDVGNAVSSRPVLQLGEYLPNVVFRIEDGRYIYYIQEKFRALRNRFPDAEYRINPKMGVLTAYEKGKPIAGLMPCIGNTGTMIKDTAFAAVPVLEAEAIKADFIPRPALEL